MSVAKDAADHEIHEDEREPSHDLPLAHAALGPTIDEERRVLMELFDATQGPHWDKNRGWGTMAPIAEWYGVTLNQQGRVAELKLGENKLKGSLPESIGNLTCLTILNSGSNESPGRGYTVMGALTGPVPETLGMLSNLRELRLNHNQLSGPVPDTLGMLSNLRELRLTHNKLSGPVPETLGRLSNLQELNLSYNKLSGQVPESVGNLSNLQELQLFNNWLSGLVPESVGNLSNLREVHLGYNKLSGNLPSSLGNLTNLTKVYLFGNQFSGPVPETLGRLSNLQILDLSKNQLSGEIPETLGNLPNLRELRVDCYQFSGKVPAVVLRLKDKGTSILLPEGLELPDDIGDIGADITRLELSNMGLKGVIPETLGNLSKLVWLRLDTNQFSGLVPESLGNLSNLRELYLSNNKLSGGIPETLGNLSSLEVLQLDNNQFSGAIPETLGILSKLKWLQLNNNQFSGKVPVGVLRLKAMGGNTVHLPQGLELPENIGDIGDHVTRLDLSNMGLRGGIPETLGNLSNLRQLNLYDNQFSGKVPVGVLRLSAMGKDILLPEGLELPENIGDIGDNVARLNLSNMGLRGIIPESIGYLTALIDLRLDKNALTGEVPVSILRFKALGLRVELPEGLKLPLNIREIGNDITSLDLSSMGLAGQIPASVASLTRLTLLNLEKNQFSGPICFGILQLAIHGTHVILPDGERLSADRSADAISFQQQQLVVPLDVVSRNEDDVHLDLSNRDLTGGLFQFRWLWTLSNLTVLNLANNYLDGPLPIELVSLQRLTVLDVSKNIFSGNLPECISKLVNLEELRLDMNQFTGCIPDWIGNMTLLKEMHLSDNRLTGCLPNTLGSLQGLRTLSLSGNLFEGEFLPSVFSFPRLERLFLENNKLTSLSLDIFREDATPNLTVLRCKGNPLRQPPPEVLPNELYPSLEAVRRYVSLYQYAYEYSEMKLAIVGKENVGKTVLTYRLMGEDGDARACLGERCSTSGVHHARWVNPLKHEEDCDAKRLVLIIWDYAGQHEYRTTHQCFFTSQALYLLVFDLNLPKEESAAQVIQWSTDVRERVLGAVFVLVGTKADQVKPEVARERYLWVLTELHRDIGSRDPPNPLVLPSLEDDHGDFVVGCTDEYIEHNAGTMERLRERLVRIILDHRHHFPHLFEIRPDSLVRTLNSVLSLGRCHPFGVPVEEIAATDDEERLMGLRFWHEVGMCLWYDSCENLRRFVFHDPMIVSEILKVLVQARDSNLLTENMHKDLRNGLLTKEMIRNLWSESFQTMPGPPSEQLFCSLLIAFLQRLDLIVEAPSEGPLGFKFIVPMLLKRMDDDPREFIPPKKQREKAKMNFHVRTQVYLMRITFGQCQNLPWGLFQRLLARLSHAKGDILDDCDLPEESQRRDWLMYRNCLTDWEWFALYSDSSNVLLRIDCSEEGDSVPYSRFFAKRVWGILCSLIQEFYKGLQVVSTYITLEDWSNHHAAHETYSLREIWKDEHGFVKDRAQMLTPLDPHIASARPARELWRINSLSEIDFQGVLEVSKLRIHSRVLGVGGFGDVYRGSYEVEGIFYPVAVKEVKYDDDPKVLMEYELHARLRHTSLLRMYGCIEVVDDRGTKFLRLILEYAKFKDLQTVYKATRDATQSSRYFVQQALDPRQRVIWLRDVIDAVEYLHSGGVIHRDIKCGNIMLREDFKALLGDLGWAKRQSSEDPCTSANAGTSVYRAPEIPTDGPDVPYSSAVDIYSFGITTIELLTMYPVSTPETGIKDLQRQPNIPEHELGQLCLMVGYCTRKAPDQRPNAKIVGDWLESLWQDWGNAQSFPVPAEQTYLPPRIVEEPAVTSITQDAVHDGSIGKDEEEDVLTYEYSDYESEGEEGELDDDGEVDGRDEGGHGETKGQH